MILRVQSHICLVAVVVALAFGPATKAFTPRASIVSSRTSTKLHYYQNQTSTEVAQETDRIPAETLDKLEAAFNEDYNWASGNEYKEAERGDFYEDGTPYHSFRPSLKKLQEWTQEYIDAVDLAGGMTRVSVGVQNLMSEDYCFTSKTIGPINKRDFCRLMSFYQENGLDLASAIPDLTVEYSGWHQDPQEPWRVWVIARYKGTHAGDAAVPNSGIPLPATNRAFVTGPELQSFLWTPDKKILWQTMGFIGDSFTGSNEGHGAVDGGLLVSMGLPHLYLEATQPVRNVQSWFSQFSSSEIPKTQSSYSTLPQWWHERKSYEDLNVHK